MKLVKMSMVAALLVGSSAFAIENTQVSGDAKLFYSTSDAKGGTTNILKGENGSGSLFDKDSSAADAAFNLDVTTDLVSNDFVKVSAGAGYTVLTTLGLENNLVSNVWGNSHGATPGTDAAYAGTSHPSSPFGGAKVENANWFKEAWIAATAGKTTAKLGRMELDTPLAYSEKWSAEVNTFEGIVAINQDIPNTTVVGAYLGNGNGNETFVQDVNGTVAHYELGAAGVVNESGKFTTFGRDGAYALGVVNNSFKPLNVQAWYYAVKNVADAYWLQADLSMEGILAGAQYSDMKLDNRVATSARSNDVYALMLGYEMKDVVTLKGAYSQTGNSATFGKADLGAGSNVATNTGDTKLYTKTFWNYGYNVVNLNNADAMKLSVSSPVNGLFDVCASYTNVEAKPLQGQKVEFQEIALVVKKSFGPLDAQLAYVNVDDKFTDALDPTESNSDDYNMVIAKLGLNF